MVETGGAVSSPSRAVQTLRERQCASCGDPLHGKRGKRYCDARCRAKGHRVRKTEQARKILQTLKDNIAEIEVLVSRE